jgi:multidrug efflux pump subunit AcrA (membrane-fusion protein)
MSLNDFDHEYTFEKKLDKHVQLPIAKHLHFKKLLSFFGVLLFIITITPWQQTAITKGRVVAFLAQERRFELHSPMEGRLKIWHVVEGQKVKKGQVLLELSDNDPEIVTRLQGELSAVSSQVQSYELALKTSELNVKRQFDLYQQGLVSKLSYETSKIDNAKIKAELEKHKTEKERISVRLSRQNQQTILSPSDGVVVQILKNAIGGSQFVKTGETLALIAPEIDKPAVEFWIQGIDVPLLKVGREVRIQFDGWPAVFFSGWPKFSIGTFKGKIAVIDELANAEGYVRVLVEAGENEWPSNSYLKQGTLAKGWILLNQVTVGYEIWRQFNGFPRDFL